MTDQPQPVDRAPTRFTKKPITIDAFRLGIDPMPDWFMDAVTRNEAVLHLDRIGDDRGATIKTLEGDHWARATEDPDWVVRGVMGEIYPIKPDIFRLSYVLPSEADPVAPAMRAEVVRLREEVARLREDRTSLARLERLYGEGAGGMTLSRLVGWACREIERTRLECESAQVEADDLRGEFRRTLDSVEASVRDKMPARFDLIALELARQAMHFAGYAKVKSVNVVTDYDRMQAPLPGDLVYANGRRSPDGIGILVRAKGHGEWDILNLATGAVDSWGNQDFYCMVPAERVKEEWLPSARATLSRETK